MMNLEKKFFLLLEEQRELDKLINAPANRNPMIAVVVELVEMMNSLDWKWWKSQPIDSDNLKIEYVDILHFILSEINMRLDDGRLTKKYLKYLINKSLLYNFGNYEKLEQLSSYNKVDYIISCVNIASSDEVSNDDLFYILQLFSLSEFYDFDDAITLYYGKKALNELRSNYGYNNGNYIKQWEYNGVIVEDNVVMMRLFDNYEINKDNIYDALEDYYKTNVQNGE